MTRSDADAVAPSAHPQTAPPGRFLCLEGLDGAGKTTQIVMLTEWLRQRGIEPVLCRDPGQTHVGEQIRELLLDPKSDIGMTCEMLLYMSSRAQMVEEVIRPALAVGRTVLCDRYVTSTVVYQGYAGGLDPNQILQVGAVATQGVFPDWIGVLDVDLQTSQQRRGSTGDRIESRSDDFHRRVRDGYRAEAARDETCTLIDASRPPRDVHETIVQEVMRVLDTAAGA